MLVLLAIFAAPGFARAEGGGADTSAWDRTDNAALRLLSGREATDTATVRAGVEITLNPGWKTYWRYPGNSGVPPRFDFSASDNVAAVVVAYPAPMRFEDGNGTSIGYGERVVFPLQVAVKDPSKPVTLRAKIDYAICAKLCVPVEAKVALSLQKASAATDTLLRAAHAQVPRAATSGGAGTLAIIAAKQTYGEKPGVSVDVKVPTGTSVDLFAEGPTTDWNLPLPQPVAGGAPGTQRFSFELDGLPSGAAAKGAIVILTATAGAEAIEVPVTLE